ncbi:MAG: methyltransferase domain-containing protein [Candidatus Dadabacteria bacterium]|nr:MAG: methyltransferase domain-containing protein [Candidatus Dadabacteria bacterium]
MSPDHANWYCCRFCINDVEENGYLLLELGAEGLELQNDNEVLAYLSGNCDTVLKFTTEAQELGFKYLGSQPLPQVNWAESCKQLWKQVTVGKLRIVPWFDSSAPQDLSTDIIYIKPGSGFGTGHHATTAMMLELLQNDLIQDLNPTSAIDIGTGSGVLAVTVCKLYGTVTTAIDNDYLAISNATENLSLNGVSNIRLQKADLKECSGKYDLVMANLYAEILIDNALNLLNLCSARGLLVLSGIMDEKFQQVVDCYTALGVGLKVSLKRDGWSAAVMG